MSHPLAPDLKNLSEEELTAKISEIHKRLGFAYMRNAHVASQLLALLDDYQVEYSKRIAQAQKEMEEELGEDFFSDKIDIK